MNGLLFVAKLKKAMGVIEEGKVTGTIPNDAAFAVHLPAYFSSTDRAVHCLGGTQAILDARSSLSNKLEFYFRPEDPYSHPVSGALRTSNNLLLKISTNNARDNAPSADIVARIPEAYHYEGMADYQYVVAVHAENARKKKWNWSEMDELHYDADKDKLRDLAQDDQMILLPPLFSLKDVPENLVLRPPPPNLNSKKKQEDDVENNFKINIEPSLAIDFNVKEIPKEVNWKECIEEGSVLWKGQMAVSELFEERPIWPKNSLTERLLDKDLKFNMPVLKRLLLTVAYYFSSGPFLRFWIRKGYDPRRDPDSRIYQRMEFRVPAQLRSYCDTNAANSVKHGWEDLCKFRVFPVQCQTSFQLYELDDDFIQQEIRKPTKRMECTYGTGWFSQQVLESLRLRVMVKFLSVYPEAGAEKLLKAAYDEFQKSKRACTCKDVSKPVQEENQQIDTDYTGNTAEGGLDNIEADDNDYEEHEEELDEYEVPDSAEEEGDITLPSDLHLDMKNKSTSYLQELFDSFPSAYAGVEDANSGDEEYQIYEQDNDEDYTDYEDD